MLLAPTIHPTREAHRHGADAGCPLPILGHCVITGVGLGGPLA
jgi:hypothetical protein